MTVTDAHGRRTPGGAGSTTPAGGSGDVAPVRGLCPYLAADGNAWRSGSPAAEHRCTAVEPAAPLTLDKQRRLCAVEAHVECATYRAAVAATSATSGASRWAFTTTLPVVLDHGRLPMTARIDRRTGQVALGGLMVLAFAAVLVARLPTAGGAPAGLASTAGPSPAAATAPSPSPTRASTPTPSPSVSAEPAPPTAIPVPTGVRYIVRSGDTLVAIAQRFRTTVAAIAERNRIADPSVIQVGQVLDIPAGGD